MEQNQLFKINEPKIKFGYGQLAEDPRDGLALFGPFDRGDLNDFTLGVVGTTDGIKICKRWLKKVRGPVFHPTEDIANPFFPGLEETFGISFNENATKTIELDQGLLDTIYRFYDNHIRVAELVSLYVEAIQHFVSNNERTPDVWILMVPDKVYAVGRPKSSIPKKDSIPVGFKDKYSRIVPGMFETEEERRWRTAYLYENHFHNQLKRRLLGERILTQIIRESTISNEGMSIKEIEVFNGQETAKAWNLSTALYYKLGGTPWKLSDIRRGVCYIGLTFKQDLTNNDPTYACCAAQMFLDSGDGMVFRGRVGPYYNPTTHEYHLSKEQAKEILHKALQAFDSINDTPAKQIFIHGKTFFNDEEWSGFVEAAEGIGSIIGVRIRPETTFKLFRNGNYPIMRGTAYLQDERRAYLWTKGFIPRIQSVLGLETPNPMLIQIVRGKASIKTVCKDILALTKLNYNSCKFCDGQPVTLKFADMIGEILTAGPAEDLEILPFKYYI